MNKKLTFIKPHIHTAYKDSICIKNDKLIPISQFSHKTDTIRDH